MNKIILGDAFENLKKMDSNSVDCIVTSPPYFQLRKYGESSKELGQEETIIEYINNILKVFNECKRVLNDNGTLFINISDTYVGTGQKNNDEGVVNNHDYNFRKNPTNIKRKSLIGIPERLMIEMINNGWILRNKIIWHKPNAMPSSVKDRFTVDYEVVYFFVKSTSYFFNQLMEPMKSTDVSSPRGSGGVIGNMNSGKRKQDKLKIKTYENFNSRYDKNEKMLRNKRSVWSISTSPSSIEHFAMMPKELAELLIKAGCPKEGIVLDPFAGSGTTLIVAKENNYKYIGIELYKQNVSLIKKRLNRTYYQLNIFDSNQEDKFK